MEFDFAQNTKVADINKIPQDFRGLYKASEDGTSHTLDTDNPGTKSAVSAITGLNNALKAARLEAKNRTTPTIDLTPLKDFGDTPEKILEAVNGKINGLTEQVKGVNIPKIKEDLATEFTGKLTAAEQRSLALEKQLHETLVIGAGVSALAAEGGDAELLMPFVQKQVKATVKDGKYVVNVVDGAGDIRFSGVTGAPMSVAELVKEMKGQEKFGRLFKSEAPEGGGAQPGASSRPGAAAAAAAAAAGRKDTDMSPAAKIAAGLKSLTQGRRAGAGA